MVSAADILHRPAQTSFQTANGVDRRLTFISGGFCQFAEPPPGCTVFGSFETKPLRPSTNGSSHDENLPVTPIKRSIAIVSYEVTPETPVKRPFSAGPSQTKSSPDTPLKRPLFIGPTQDKSSPETPLKRPRYNENDEFRLRFHWKGLDEMRLVNHFCGLYNFRNDCFMNSVLQFVFHTPQLIRYIQSRKNNHHCPSDQARCIYCILNTYITRISRKIGTFEPKHIRNFVNSLFPNRIPNNQEDAHEMLIFLLSRFEPPLPRRTNGHAIQPPSAKPPPLTDIDRIFGGKLCNKLYCKECKSSQCPKEQVRELNLNLRECDSNYSVPLIRYIKSYFKQEYLDDYKCDECSQRKCVVRQLYILEAPQILIIQLIRFRCDGSKNSVEVDIPLKLDLYEFTLKKTPLEYRLYGFISHSGRTASSGHYTSTMRGYNNEWYRFNDDSVTHIQPKSFGTQPYLLFYYKHSY